MTVTGSTLSNNYANFGAAVAVLGGSLAVTGSTISNNDIGTSGNGGGIGNSGGVVTITDSTISNNTARIGGGIFNENGVMNITNSTVSGNIAKPEVTYSADGYRIDYYGYGGGIFNTTGATLTVTNSTFSGNRADGYNASLNKYGGGGIYNFNSSTATILNSTITNNYGQRGGGIFSWESLNLSNTIVAGNIASSRDPQFPVAPYGSPDIYAFNEVVGGDYNLLQDTSGYTLSGTHNITGLPAMLGPLANNGGPTQTHALLAGSPAIDAGDPNFNAVNLPYDQRGAGFPRVRNGRLDIGAYELDTYQSGANFTVNTLSDGDDGICGSSNCTLREAVKYAPDGTVIAFSVAGTLTLTGGELAVTKNLTISGAQSAPGTTISGNNASRIFTVSTAGVTLNLSALNLTGGSGVGGGTNSGNGGAIAVDPNTAAIVTNCAFFGNKAAGNGGAIRNGGTLTVTSSTFSGNNAGYRRRDSQQRHDEFNRRDHRF